MESSNNDSQPRLLELFRALGLRRSEAEVYHFLLKKGESPASVISKNTGIARTNTYSVLDSLIEKGLVFQDATGKRKVFQVKHPEALRELAAGEEQRIRQVRAELDRRFDTLLSEYAITSHVEGIFRFSGADGLRRALGDIARDGDTLHILANPSILNAFLGTPIDQKLPGRIGEQTAHRLLFHGGEEKDFGPVSTPSCDVRVSLGKAFSLDMGLFITKTQVIVAMLKKGNSTGVVLADQDIARNYLCIFELLWEQASPRTANHEARQHASAG